MTIEAKNPPIKLSGPYVSGLSATLLFGALVAGIASGGPVEADNELFEQHEVVTGIAQDQTVLPGFFLGGPKAELAIVHLDENNRARVRMFGFKDNVWGPVLSAKLGPGVLFVDVANIGGRDRLITYRRGEFSWFDPDSATERELVEIAIGYRATDTVGIPHLDVTRDLNHNGRDDLLIPDVDGFWIAIQMRDGLFSKAVKLGPPEPFRDETIGNFDTGEGGSDPSRTYGEVGITVSSLPLYLSRVHEMDYDLDGRNDLVFWNADHFDVHLQDENGLFSPVAVEFNPDVAFDSDGVYSYAFQFKDQGVLGVLFGFTKKVRRTVLYSLRDLNGDRVADLVTLTLSGRSFAKQRSVYEVHFGRSTPDGVAFEQGVDTAIHPRGKAGGMQPWGYSSQWFQDIDGDGQVDILFRDVNTGFGGMGRALVGNSVPINLEIYRNESGIYPGKPTARRKVRRFAPLAGMGNVFFPTVLMGDVNGDGRSDLLVGHSPEELQIFLGEPGPDLLARRPQTVAVSLPYDERNTWLFDVNKDGKQDLLMHHAPTERAPDDPHRLTTLIAR